MLDQSTPSKRKHLSNKIRDFYPLKMVLPFCVTALLSVIISCALIYNFSWLSPSEYAPDIISLKNNAAVMSQRLAHLEEDKKTPSESLATEKLIQSLEENIANVQHQIEIIFNQLKERKPIESQEQSSAFTKELYRLDEQQQNLKSAYLFLRLKEKVLSNQSYVSELNAFKNALKEAWDLSTLEKYAHNGLQVLQETTHEENISNKTEEQESMWQGFIKKFGNLIKIQRIEDKSSLSSQRSSERQIVEDALNQLDQLLNQKLAIISIPTSSQPGDVL